MDPDPTPKRLEKTNLINLHLFVFVLFQYLMMQKSKNKIQELLQIFRFQRGVMDGSAIVTTDPDIQIKSGSEPLNKIRTCIQNYDFQTVAIK